MNRVKISIFFLTGLLAVFALTSCTEKVDEGVSSKIIKPPYEIPFSVDRGGETLEFEIEIIEQKLYSFGLTFKVNDNIPDDRIILKKLVGSAKRDGNYKYVDLGVPLMVHLQITSLDTTKAKFELDKKISEIGLESWGSGSYEKKVLYVRLEPNKYKVRVKNLLAAPEMTRRGISFYVYKAYIGK